MKKFLFCLLMLLCTALLCGAFAALAEEVEIELTNIDVETFSPEGLLLEEPEGTTDDGNPGEDLPEPLDIDGALMLDEISVPEDINTEGLLADALSANDSDPSDFVIVDGVLRKYNGKDADVVIPDGVTEIGEYAFYENYYIKSVTIPSGVTKIGPDAFHESSIENVTIPNTVTEIGRYAFAETALKSVTIPSSVESITESMFDSCSSLESATISTGVTTIGEGAFSGCSSLHSIDIPESVISMEEHAFSYSGLSSIVIPGSIKTIGLKAFYRCDCLSDVIISEGTEVIEDYAFYYCSLLYSVKLPSTIKHIGDYAFTYTVLSELTPLPYGLTTLGDYCFSETRIESFEIPDSVTTMGEGVFSDNEKLTELILPKNMKVFPANTVRGCENLKSITLPDGLETIGDGAFAGTGITSIYLPDSVTSLGKEAFYYAPIKEIRFSCGMKKIESLTFSHSDLESITIPGYLKTIGEEAFNSCGKLKTVVIESGLETIESDAFSDCTHLKDITIPESVKNIYTYSIGYSSWTLYGRQKTSLNIHGKAGTMAERYAKINEFPFIIDAESISIVPNGTQTIKVGDTLKLNAELTPSDSNADINWTSSNTSVATVGEDGTVTALGKGRTTITASTWNGVSASIEVKVVLPEPEGVSITQGSSATLYMGNKLTLKAKVKPSNARTKLTWKSSKPKIAAVSSKGVVTPKAAGSTVITVKTGNGKSAKITVKVIDAKSVKLKEGASKTLKVGKKLTLHATVSPSKVKTKLTWTSSNKKVATVSSKGVVKAIKAGTAKITVKTANGKKATITITVN